MKQPSNRLLMIPASSAFSAYSAASNSKLSVSVIDDNGKITPDEVVSFAANYSNRSSGALIDGSCNISFGNGWIEMEQSDMYSYNRSFDDLRVRSYTEGYNVTCFGAGFEGLNYSSSVDVELNTTLLTLNGEFNASDNLKESSLVLADWNDDGWVDLIYTGYNDMTNTRPLYIYMNNQSSFVFSQNESGIRRGSIATPDYDKDSNVDIVLVGDISIDTPDKKIYKKK